MFISFEKLKALYEHALTHTHTCGWIWKAVGTVLLPSKYSLEAETGRNEVARPRTQTRQPELGFLHLSGLRAW